MNSIATSFNSDRDTSRPATNHVSVAPLTAELRSHRLLRTKQPRANGSPVQETETERVPEFEKLDLYVTKGEQLRRYDFDPRGVA